jgi:hypothetical protein
MPSAFPLLRRRGAYSALILFTGFATAALILSKLTVIIAISIDKPLAPTNIQGPIVMR